MRALLDTNIILDALQERQPFDTEAKEILRRAQNGELTAMFTANAATDIFFLYSRARDAKSARAALAFLLNSYGVVDVTHENCLYALKLAIEDFEDALVCVCALSAKADCIVTRDEGFLQAKSPVRVISPAALLAEMD